MQTKPTMKHAYKTQLQSNLQAQYSKKDWIVKSNFENGRDEILFVLPNDENIGKLHANLYEELSALPEIGHPSERVLISFCHVDGSGYCSQLINPNKQDQINMALLGKLPTRRISETELQSILL